MQPFMSVPVCRLAGSLATSSAEATYVWSFAGVGSNVASKILVGREEFYETQVALFLPLLIILDLLLGIFGILFALDFPFWRSF